MSECNAESLLALSWDQIRSPGNTNWHSKLKNIYSAIGSDDGKPCKEILSDLDIFFKKAWEKYISRPEGKLRTYAKIKSRFRYENYLSNITNPLHRQALCRLRTSSHPLMIEKGRYTRPIAPVDERKCSSCGVVEDEFHFLISCQLYSVHRQEMIATVNSKCINFINLSCQEKFLFLLSAEGDIARAVAKYSFKAFELRKQREID